VSKLKKVILIGLNWTSLAAANVLRKYSIPFLILESRQNIEETGFDLKYEGLNLNLQLPWFDRSDSHLIKLFRGHGLDLHFCTYPSPVKSSHSKNLFDPNRLVYQKPLSTLIDKVVDGRSLQFDKHVSSMRFNKHKDSWTFLDGNTGKTMLDDVTNQPIEASAVILCDQASNTIDLVKNNKSLQKFHPYLQDSKLIELDGFIGNADEHQKIASESIETEIHEEWIKSYPDNRIFCGCKIKASDSFESLKALSYKTFPGIQSYLATKQSFTFILDPDSKAGVAGPAVSGALPEELVKSG